MRQGVEARNTALFRELANLEDDTLMSQNNPLVGAWMPDSFMDRRRGGSEEKSKKTI